MNEGWKCPNCGSAHPPWVETCPNRTKGEVLEKPVGLPQMDKYVYDGPPLEIRFGRSLGDPIGFNPDLFKD